MLPSTSEPSLWVVSPLGCPSSSGPGNCANLRGFLFNPNKSASWEPQDIYELPAFSESSLGYTGNASLGFDNVTLGWPGSGGPTLKHQAVFAYAAPDFYIGSLGLTPRPTNITGFSDQVPSMLGLLRNQSVIPSSSYGYTAGAIYKKPQPVFGSLTLGGYDATRMAAENLTVKMGPDDTRDMLIGLEAIRTGTTELLPSPVTAYIDSTVSHIWLPKSACPRVASTFDLEWNPTIRFFLVNETQHDALIARNPSLVLSLSNGADRGTIINITLPYASLDLTLGYPLVGNSTSRYFPIRCADNDTQYTLGRVFLQEAFLIADYERSIFSISPARFPDPVTAAELVSIYPPDASHLAPLSQPESGVTANTGLAGGAIAGIVIVVALSLVGILVLAIWYAKRQKAAPTRHAIPLMPDDNLPPDQDFKAHVQPYIGQKVELDAEGTKFSGHEVTGDNSPISPALSGGSKSLDGFPFQAFEVVLPTEKEGSPTEPAVGPFYEMEATVAKEATQELESPAPSGPSPFPSPHDD